MNLLIYCICQTVSLKTTLKDCYLIFSVIMLSQEMFMLFFCHCLSATNINDAVLRAVRMLMTERAQGSLPERSADMIILLTDGMPNSGELS